MSESTNSTIVMQDDTINNSVTEKLDTVKTLVTAYNNALDKEEVGVMATTETLLADALKTLNTEEKSAQLYNWATSDDPVLICLQDGGTYALTGIKKDKDTGYILIVGKTTIVDLKELYTIAKHAFADNKWLFYSEAANFAIRDYIAKVMGIKSFTEKTGSIKISDAAKVLNINANDMKTAKGTTAALQKVVDSIMGDIKGGENNGKSRYMVKSEDAEAFRMNYSQWGKTINSVSLSMEATFRKMLTRILVKIVNDLEYIGE